MSAVVGTKGAAMTDGGGAGGFLGRWARRKQAARTEAPATATSTPDPAPTAQPTGAEPPFDLTALPRIEDLTGQSDFSLFLNKAVPDALRREALRKLWLVDASVRDYKPLVEYDWDFNSPGYGKLLPTDDVQRLARALFEPSEAAPAEPQPAPTPADPEPDAAAGIAAAFGEPGPPSADREPPTLDSAGAAEGAAVDSITPEPTTRRRHGGALPA